ncbi:hypothetical protein GCM10027446_11130 [Angustibacter peucedani]
MSAHHLTATGPHDGVRLLAFVAAHVVPGVEHWDGATWTSSLHLPHGAGLARVRAARGGFDVQLHLVDDHDEPVALQRLQHLLDLGSDVRPAERVLAADPLMAPLVARRPGLRVPGTADPFETLVRTVVGQQVSLAGARTVTGRLVAAAGRRLPTGLRRHAPEVTHLFPTPAAVRRLTPDDDALAMPAARARAVVACAAAVDDAGGLPSREELLALPGIGPWTADYLDLRARRDPDVFLPTDLAVRRALERLGLDGSPAAARATSERWRPYRSTALLHLWSEYLGL